MEVLPSRNFCVRIFFKEFSSDENLKNISTNNFRITTSMSSLSPLLYILQLFFVFFWQSYDLILPLEDEIIIHFTIVPRVMCYEVQNT